MVAEFLGCEEVCSRLTAIAGLAPSCAIEDLSYFFRRGGEASFLSIHSTCSASTSQQAATSSNALFMDRSFACAARFLASAALCRYMSARGDI